MSIATINKSIRGFTLIELLIVIAVIGVLAAGVVAAINPLKRINQANDSKIKNDIGQIATALQAYYTTNQLYPSALSALATSGELKLVPTAPGGSSYTYSVTTCTTSSCEASISFALRDPAVTGNLWCWRSAVGTASEVTSAAGCAP